MNNVVSDLKILQVKNVIEHEPLYKHTSFKVGGPSRIFVDAIDLSDLTTTIQYALDNNIKYFILGKGSNVLINDLEFEGIVVCTAKLNSFEINDTHVYAMTGVNLITLAIKCANLGLSGLEFASGIPGTIGGAIFMNAGAYKKDMSDIVKRVLVYRNRKQEWLDVKEMELAYRSSIMQSNRDWIILAVELSLLKADTVEILKLIEDRKIRRISSQPYDLPSAGSVFKNPSPEVFSWQLIDDVGLRGKSINDAQVSLKHSNFIVNNDRASAKDIYDLINLVREEVYKHHDMLLKIEVELVNFDE